MQQVWMDRLRSLIKAQEFKLAQLASEVDRALDSTRVAQDDLRLVKVHIDAQRVSLQARFANLELMRDDPEVLARVYGANCDTYHSAVEPCGLVPPHAPKLGSG